MNFTARRDSINSIDNSISEQNMYFRTVTTDFNQLPYFEVDSTFTQNVYYNITIDDSEEPFLNFMTLSRGTGAQYFLQGIVNGEIKYGSFMVQFRYEGEDVCVYAIENPGVKDINHQPTLVVEYYDIPQPRL